MSDQVELNPAERELEGALKSLAPRAARLNPVAAAYSAGQLSARREVQRWRVATVGMALLGAVTWLLPVGQSLLGEKQVGGPVAVAVSAERRPVSEQSMVMLQKAVWEKGVDGLIPVQLAPTKVIHIEEINSTHKGES
jgi:hypothetical protein